MFSVRSVVELGKAIAKAALIGGVATWLMWHNKEALIALATESAQAGVEHAGRLIAICFVTMIGGMGLIAAVDVPFQIWDYRRKLRMTREELRQEAKETEGDPQIKARVRSVQREMARRRMMAEVPNADVVVTNPAHYAVALKYRDGSMRAPVVVAKGADLVAARIREIAGEHRVPLLEAPPLARALYAHTELGAEIPEALYRGVAEVLAYVFQLRHYRQHGGAEPQAPHEIHVPADLDPARAAGAAQ
jgi:flagellar biosynthetic protein FlhB